MVSKSWLASTIDTSFLDWRVWFDFGKMSVVTLGIYMTLLYKWLTRKGELVNVKEICCRKCANEYCVRPTLIKYTEKEKLIYLNGLKPNILSFLARVVYIYIYTLNNSHKCTHNTYELYGYVVNIRIIFSQILRFKLVCLAQYLLGGMHSTFGEVFFLNLWSSWCFQQRCILYGTSLKKDTKCLCFFLL